MSNAKVGYAVKVEKGREKVLISSELQREEGMRAEFVCHPAEGNDGEFSMEIPKTLKSPRAANPGQFSPPWSRAPLPPHSTPPAGAVQFSVGFNSLCAWCVFPPASPGPGKQLELGSLVTLHPSWSGDTSPPFPRVNGEREGHLKCRKGGLRWAQELWDEAPLSLPGAP